MQGVRTDEQLAEFLSSSKPGTAVVEFGTSWCHKCHEMFPQFYKLSKQVRVLPVVKPKSAGRGSGYRGGVV
jgi:thiol-disulfide isomerase/thioredoxin